MGSPCLDPAKTFYQKLLEAVAFSEVNRADADEVIASYRPEVERDVRRRHKLSDMAPPSEREITVATELRAMADSAFKNAMENERWGWRLALMYAAVVQVDEQFETRRLLRELLAELRRRPPFERPTDPNPDASDLVG